MFKNYLKIAFRNIRKHKIFTLINISGLAIGISAALVIYLIVSYQYSFDKFHKNRERIYRVVSRIDFPDLVIRNSGVPVPTAKAVKEEVTGLELASHFMTISPAKISIPDGKMGPGKTFKKQNGIIYADRDYFKLFTYDWLAGSPTTALNEPFRIVLTESRAKAYFGDLSYDATIGKNLNYDDSIRLTVSGIVKDLDEITDFTFKEFVSLSTIENSGLRSHWNWGEWGSINSASQLFVRLSPGTSPNKVETQIVSLRNKYRENKDKKDDTRHSLQPLADIHFNGDYGAYDQAVAHKPTLYGLFAVALFLLMLGCINFINLTTSQAAQRAKEIGIRKTMGGSKAQLIFQFLGETFFLALLATVLSVVLVPSLLKIFSDFIPQGISFRSLNQVHVWIFLLILVILVSLLSGFYPALILTRFQPVNVLKNQAHSGTAQTRSSWLRKTLTVTQFIIAQFLIIATLLVTKQINYSLNKELGYKKEAIVFIGLPWNFFSEKKDDRRFALLEKIKAIPEIENVSLSGAPPASGNTSSTTMKFARGEKLIETMVEIKYADTSYFDLYRMKLIAGNNLKQSDTTKEFVINETYARFLGFTNPRDAIGQFIDRDFKVPIVGVVEDFHTKSTHEPIKPLAYSSAAENSYTIHLALKPRGMDGELWKRAISKVEKSYKDLYAEDDFSYTFYDESIAAFYKTEQNINRLLKWSSGLCIFISCLGLLGLVMYTTSLRIKEIGVRKVLGASAIQIVSMLSSDFMKLVILAFLIATPLAWWALNDWLGNFEYRTELSWWIFAIAGLGMLIIALLTLSIQTIRSAIANPVEALRSE
jgi:putative ABC transport system permease protein